jgi:hypothetical protein
MTEESKAIVVRPTLPGYLLFPRPDLRPRRLRELIAARVGAGDYD